MSLSPYTSSRYKEDTCNADPTKVVSGQKSNSLVTYLELENELDGYGGKLRRGNGGHDGNEAQNGQHAVTFPYWPILDMLSALLEQKIHGHSQEGHLDRHSVAEPILCTQTCLS